MKIFTRLAAAVSAALVSLFVVSPAFASEGEKVDYTEPFSSAGEPVNVAGILITGAVLLVVVLVLATLISNSIKSSASSGE